MSSDEMWSSGPIWVRLPLWEGHVDMGCIGYDPARGENGGVSDRQRPTGVQEQGRNPRVTPHMICTLCVFQ